MRKTGRGGSGGRKGGGGGGRGRRKEEEEEGGGRLPSGSQLSTLAKFHDLLGWDCFVEGRVCSLWVEARHQEIEATASRRNADFWGRGLIHHLLQLTHRQWIYRNMVVHTQVGGNLSAKQHQLLMERVEMLLQTDPHELLPEHRELLEMDFEKVGSGSPIDLQLWAEEMDSAVAATSHVCRGSSQALRTRYCSGPNACMSVIEEQVFVDSEGSIRWRRR